MTVLVTKPVTSAVIRELLLTSMTMLVMQYVTIPTVSTQELFLMTLSIIAAQNAILLAVTTQEKLITPTVETVNVSIAELQIKNSFI